MTSEDSGNRRSKRSTKTRAMITEAAGRVLAERGYDATSIDVVALEAGVTRGTVYYHFDAKEDIYAAVVFQYLESAYESLARAVEEAPDIAGALMRIINDQIDDTLDPSRRYVHYQEFVKLGDAVRLSIRAAQQRYEHRLAEIIAAAQEAGAVRPGDPYILAKLLIGSIGRTARWYRPDGRVSEPEFRGLVKQTVMQGLFVGS
jgi:AcrR family transcriptional regulator